MTEADAVAALPSTTSSSLYDEALDMQHVPPPELAVDLDRERAHPARYAFAQAFGERTGDPMYHYDVADRDMLTAVRINEEADMVATGDRGGRIVLLKRKGDPSTPRRRRGGGESDDPDVRPAPAGEAGPPDFQFWTQFQSHDPEFDYLKSMEIEEKINEVRWVRSAGGAHRLLAANDKTIKLWRVFEKDIKEVFTVNADGSVAKRRVLSPSSANVASNNPWGFGKSVPPGVEQYTAGKPRSPTSSQELMMPNGLKSPLTVPGEKEASFAELREQFRGINSNWLKVPQVAKREQRLMAEPRRVFSNAHAYHINSVSLSSDEETFLTADDLRVNMWNLTVGQAKGFNVVDIKPDNMEDLTEVITCAEFHPESCHLFLHASSRGVVKLCDLRQKALCDEWAKEFVDSRVTCKAPRSSFFSEIIASVSDARFSPNARYIVTRDYMTLRLWDVNMERAPLLTVPVHEHIRPRLSDMYDNDCVFDKFECAFSHDGCSILTGSYNSLFQSYSALDGLGTAVEASVDFAAGLAADAHLSDDNIMSLAPHRTSPAALANPTRKILHIDSAANAPVVAVAAGPALYMYYVPNSGS